MAFQLGGGVTYGAEADDDGDLNVEFPIKGMEVSAGFLSTPPSRSVFMGAQVGYSPKRDHFQSELSVLRFHFVAGPKLRVGTKSNFRAGLGLGFMKAISGEYGGVAPSLHALIGYYFPLDDYIGGFSLNYSRTLGKMGVSRNKATVWGETSPIRGSMQLHDLALKFEWHIPLSIAPSKNTSRPTSRP